MRQLRFRVIQTVTVGTGLFYFKNIKGGRTNGKKEGDFSKLEKARAELAAIEEEKVVTEHNLNRAKNRYSSAVKKQDSARKHRLIVEGAELEYVFEGIKDLPQSTFRIFMKELAALPGAAELFDRMKAAGHIPVEGGDE